MDDLDIEIAEHQRRLAKLVGSKPCFSAPLVSVRDREKYKKAKAKRGQQRPGIRLGDQTFRRTNDERTRSKK